MEFKGIEEEEEEESLADMERNSAEGDQDKGEERKWTTIYEPKQQIVCTLSMQFFPGGINN